MCCCKEPNVNGNPGYSWDGKSVGTHPVNPPTLRDGDMMLFDEPGRCGGVDSHSFHFRVVRQKYGGLALLVRHGAGEERIRLGTRPIGETLARLGSGERYWFLQCLYHVQSEAARHAATERDSVWRSAAAEKRIKTRKQRGRGTVKVWIEPQQASA